MEVVKDSEHLGTGWTNVAAAGLGADTVELRGDRRCFVDFTLPLADFVTFERNGLLAIER